MSVETETNPWLQMDERKVPVVDDETSRLAALESYEILDTLSEETYDRIVRLTGHLLQTPVALISLLDRDRQWFKAKTGTDITWTPRNVSFCQHTIRRDDPLLVLDASQDELFYDNPLVTGEPGVRFYIGVALIDHQGHRLGSLCGIDTKPRAFVTPEQTVALQDLAEIVIDQMESRRNSLARNLQQQAEISLRSMAMDSSVDGIAVTDMTGKFIYMNDAHARIFGYRCGEDLLGQSWRFLFAPEEADTMAEQIAPRLFREGRWRGESIGMRKDGSTFPQEVTLTAIGNGGLIAITRDIAERKAIENRTHELEAELLNHHKMEALGTLAGGLAHEINTPIQYVGDNITFLDDSFSTLTGILTDYRAATLEMDTPEISDIRAEEAEADIDFLLEEIPTALKQTREGVGRVRSLVSAIKKYSHPGTKEKKFENLCEAIDLAVDLSVNQWKYVADVTRDIAPDLPQIECDIGEINQVLLNILVNSAQAIEEKMAIPEKHPGDKHAKVRGHIALTARQEDSNIVIRISDTGIGIPPEHQKYIFDLFFTTKEVGRGTGQGLALCHSVIVKGHHGKIAVESQVGVGTTFTITLPVTQPKIDPPPVGE